VFFFYTTASDNRVVRFTYANGRLSATGTPIVTGIARDQYHNGGRLRDVVKTPDGTGLWLSSTNNDSLGGSPNTLNNVIVRLRFAG
jgi:hypothetical protein